MSRFKQKKSPFNLDAPRNSHPRNPFDMSYHSYFTSPAGMLLPNYVENLEIGDYLTLDVNSFSRTLPVNTAAFGRIRESTDVFFVPYSLLWRWWRDFSTGVFAEHSSYSPLSTSVASRVPFFNANSIVNWLSSAHNDIHGFDGRYWLLRMLDLLGYSSNGGVDIASETALWTGLGSTSYSMFRLVAYQRIYNDFYRNTNYESNSPKSYNLDDISGNSALIHSRVSDFLIPRYKSYEKDYFTSIVPSRQYADVTIADSKSGGNLPYIGTGGNQTATQDTYVDLNYNSNDPNDIYASLGAQQIRNLLATDKISRIQMFAPKTYEAQIQKRFGVKPLTDNHTRCQYLGSFHSDVQIGEITATSSGSNGQAGDAAAHNSLGSIAGKGISSTQGNRPITVEATEPGIVMGIHYFEPRTEYNAWGTSAHNIKNSRSDFFNPEFDNLGLTPLLTGVIDGRHPLYINNNVGWQSRYMEYKTRVGEVHGPFMTGNPLSAWCFPRNSAWSSGFTSLNELKISPASLNSIFPIAFNGNPNTDEFLCHFSFKATKVSNMSVNGLPIL